MKVVIREMAEILVNLASYNATITTLTIDSFLLSVKDRSVKLDLFYLALFSDFDFTSSKESSSATTVIPPVIEQVSPLLRS